MMEGVPGQEMLHLWREEGLMVIVECFGVSYVTKLPILDGA
jgi:hypothetical protein